MDFLYENREVVARLLVVSATIGGLVLAAVGLRRIRRDPTTGRRGVLSGMSTFLLGLGALVADSAPSSPVIIGTTMLLGGASVWLMVLEWRLSRRD